MVRMEENQVVKAVSVVQMIQVNRLFRVVSVVQVNRFVRVVKVVSCDDMNLENILFTWSNPSDY